MIVSWFEILLIVAGATIVASMFILGVLWLVMMWE